MAYAKQHLRTAFTGLVLSLGVMPLTNAESVLPGTPLNGQNFGTTDLVNGINLLPSPVQAGDVVLLENPLGTHDRTNWSDVVRYFNFQTALSGVVGVAYKISGGESGTPRIDIVNEKGVTFQPDTLSANNQFVTEIQAGTGTEADITQYRVPGALYNVHSDAASPELPETFPVLPFQPVGKGQVMYSIVEGTCGFDCGKITVPATFGPGAAPPFGDGGDILTVAPHPGDPKRNDIFLTSFADDSDSTAADDREVFNFPPGDESGGGIIIEGSDAPEPSTCILLGVGLLIIGGSMLRRIIHA